LKGIKREFSVPRTPQQNGIAERKNKTLIEAAKTMLADSLLPIPFWAEAVNTACYVQNRVFMRPFGCPMTILNTLDPLGKFEGKVDKGFLVGYYVNSKAFRVFNSRTRIVQETLHVNFLENKPNVVGIGPTWLFDIDNLTRTMNYQPVTVGNQSNPNAGFQEEIDAENIGEKATQQYMLFPVWSTGSLNSSNKEEDATFDGKEHDAEKPESVVNLSPSSSARSGEQDDMTKKKDKGKSSIEYFTGNRYFNVDFEDYSEDSSNNVSAAGPIPNTWKSLLQDASQTPEMLEREDIAYSDHENVGAEANFNNLETSITEELLQFKMQKVWILVDLPHSKRAIGTKWVYRYKKDERGIVIRNKARLVAQGHTQEEGIDYKEVFALVARIEAIRLFLAYASFMGFMVYQMDVKSTFLYKTIEEKVYVCQPPGFKDPDYPNKIYKVVKALYGLHQAPRAWYETLANYLLENSFHRGQIDQTLFIKKQKGDILLVKSASTPTDTEKPLLKDPDGEDVDVHIYRSMICSLMYLTSSRSDIMFAVCACARFYVNPKASHLHAVKRIFRYLKGKLHLGLWYPKDSPFDLVAYSDRDYAGASLDRKSTTGGCQFLGCRLISWQFKKQIVIATSSTEAEYVAGATCCAQVLWIQNQMLDYGKTTTGKEISNPFVAGSLPKTTLSPLIHVRLQALVDKKKVVVIEAAIRDALHLDDAEGIDCLPNEEIFTTLARMGYEKPSTKLTFYKAFFSSQWKFLIHTILESMSAKRTSWNEFSSAMVSAVICLSTGDLSTHFTKYISPTLIQKVFANMRRVGKGCSGVETPLFKGMLVVREPEEQCDTEEQGNDDNDAEEPVTAVLKNDVENQSIQLPTPPTLPPQKPQDIPSTSQAQSPPPQPQSLTPAQTQGADFPMSLLQEVLDAYATLARRVV
nr:putative ribonuclease H-like domain-containing protein [Tanacetum cinerariifolium]